MIHIRKLVLLSSGAVLAGFGFAALPGQSASGPTAVYYLDASTAAGPMAAMMSGKGGLGAMASMMGGGGGADQHQLTLRLGSRNAPSTGAAKADHFMPKGALLGASVPLITPTKAAAPQDVPEVGGRKFERPKGKLKLYWGCGEHAPKGQPVVIDFAKMAAGQMPPGLFSTTVPVEHPPMLNEWRTYGEWPNGKDNKSPQSKSSLLGDHRVAGNYTPEIKFSLSQDFMPGLRVRGADSAGGGVALSWGAVTGATGYYAWAMGGKEDELVWWTSAQSQQFGAGLTDWLAPATVSRLIGQKIVLPPAQTNCTIPAEVKAAAPQMMTWLTAFGPEQNFAYPPRPADPKVAWKPEWTVKARFRSTTMFMPGMDGMAGAASDNAPAPEKKKCKPSVGGILGGAMGLPIPGKGC